MFTEQEEERLKAHRIILALLCGGAMQFAFSPFELNWLAIIALTVWAWLLIRCPHPFLIGYAFGFGWFGFGSWWLADTFHLYGGLPYPVAYLCVALVGLVLGLFPALWGWLAVRIAGRSNGFVLAFAATAVLIEWLRGHIFTGLPWTSLGNLILDTPASGWAAIAGVYGTALLPALAAAGLALILDRHRSPAAVTALIVVVAISWLTPPLQQAEGETKRAALVQASIPQDVKWDRAFLNETMQRYDRLSTIAASDSDLLIWPEAAIPFFLSRAPGWDRWLRNRIAVWNRPLLFGGLKITGNPADPSPAAQNGLFLEAPGEQQRSFAGKHHLVPFGEYVPAWLPWLRALVTNIGDWQAAENGGVLKSGDAVFGALICYESIFPEEARARVEQGAQVLVVVTNDAWYGESPAAWQHLQASRMRAIETGRYVLRAANTGVSAIIAPDGTVTATMPWWQQGVVSGNFRLSFVTTTYQRWGDMPALVVAVLLLAAGGLLRKSGDETWGRI